MKIRSFVLELWREGWGADATEQEGFELWGLAVELCDSKVAAKLLASGFKAWSASGPGAVGFEDSSLRKAMHEMGSQIGELAAQSVGEQEARAIGEGKRNMDALLRGAGQLDMAAVEVLLSKGMDASAVDSAGRSLLIAAACSSQLDATRMLLSKGASAGQKDKEGMTALHRACEKRAEDDRDLIHEDVGRALIKAGADPFEPNVAGVTPWDLASAARSKRLLKCMRPAKAARDEASAIEEQLGRRDEELGRWARQAFSSGVVALMPDGARWGLSQIEARMDAAKKERPPRRASL